MSHVDTSATTGFRFDLQLFAEDPMDDSFWGEGDDTPQAEEHPATAEPEQTDDAPTQDAPQATDTPTQEPAPKKYLGRFDSEEEAERAYKYLQAEMTRMKQGLPAKNPDQLNQILSQGNEAPQRPQAQPGYPQGYPQQQPGQQVAQQAMQRMQHDAQESGDPQAFWKSFAANPQAVLQQYIGQAIQQAAEPFTNYVRATSVRQLVNDLRSDGENYPGFREMEGDIASYLQSNPWLAQHPDGVRQAYYAVAAINARTAQAYAQDAVQQDRQRVAQGKQRATLERQQQQTQPIPQPKDPNEELGDAIVAMARNRRFSI